jgi:hypothetical protein
MIACRSLMVLSNFPRSRGRADATTHGLWRISMPETRLLEVCGCSDSSLRSSAKGSSRSPARPSPLYIRKQTFSASRRPRSNSFARRPKANIQDLLSGRLTLPVPYLPLVPSESLLRSGSLLSSCNSFAESVSPPSASSSSVALKSGEPRGG